LLGYAFLQGSSSSDIVGYIRTNASKSTIVHPRI
jgi:hypothetical protein